MFDSIRRHQKWLWIVIITLTIISFVVFFSPNTQTGAGFGFSTRETVGSINGDAVTRDEYVDAYREAELRYLFTYGDWPGNNEMVRQLGLMEREVRSRLFLVRKLDELDIKVSEAAAAKWIIDAFQDRQQNVFLRDRYEQFVNQVLPSQGISKSDFDRFVKNEVGIQHLVNVAGVAGKLVTPQEAEALYRRQNEQLNTKAVFLSSTNFADRVMVTPEALTEHYEKFKANYRIPERVQVNYVVFHATNYLAEAEQQMNQLTNLNDMVEQTYAQRGTNSFVDSNNQPLPPDAAKERIRSEIRQEYALREARRKAIDFANELIDMQPKIENLPNLAAAKGLEVKVTAPFTSSETPPNLNVPATFAQAAFRLTPEEPFYEQPLVSQDAVYLISLNNRIPSEVPPLDAVRDRVVEEFKRTKTGELVRAAGDELHSTITNNLAQGKAFEAIVAEANLTAVDLPPFSNETVVIPELPNRADLNAVKSAASGLAPGKVSEFVPTRTGGFIVYLEDKVPVDDSRVQQELPDFMANLRRERQYQAFNDWLRKQMELAQISLPGDQQSAAN